MVDAVLLRPLPFKDPERIVAVWGKSDESQRDVVSYPDYTDLRDQNQTFSAITCYTRTGGALSRAEDSQFLEGVATTPEIFDVLGVPPLLGRGFTREEATENVPRVIVLTHQFWQRVFAGDRNILGQELTLSGRNYTIIGVMPPSWKFPVEDERIDYVSPLGFLAGHGPEQSRRAVSERDRPLEAGRIDPAGAGGHERDHGAAGAAIPRLQTRIAPRQSSALCTPM